MKHPFFHSALRNLLDIILFTGFAIRSNAQCSIAACENTLVFGIACENGIGEVGTIDEIR